MDKDKDQLLVIVDRIHRVFNQAARQNKDDYGNLLIKFARFYFRHQDEDKPLDKLFDLMNQKPEKRGKGYVANWHMLRDKLKSNSHEFKNLSVNELAYVLGWLAKLARS